jgi:hypothetical protein
MIALDIKRETKLPRFVTQRLEAWMKEVTDLLCYQPEVPLAHKQAVVEAMQAFTKSLNLHDAHSVVKEEKK